MAYKMSYEYKIGVKREIIQALRDAITTWPEPSLRNMMVVNEWPTKEITYPMILVKFNEQDIENMGLGHYDLEFDENNVPKTVLHWRFRGTVAFEIHALSTQDRDMAATGLLNLLAFGPHVPEFRPFWQEIEDYDFVDMTLLSDDITPGGDSNGPTPWGDDERVVFTTSYTVPIYGEFYTDPTTSGLVEINKVHVYPYREGQSVPQGSQLVVDGKDDRTVPWQP